MRIRNQHLFFILVLLFIIPLVSMAQVRFSIIGGLNVASLVGDDAKLGDLPPRNRTRIGAGMGMTMNLGGLFNLRFELLYSQKGAEYSGIGEPSEFAFSYIDFPTMLEIRFHSNTDWAPKVLLGNFISFNLMSELRTGDEVINRREEMVKTEMGIIGGVGVNFIDRFEFIIRYSMGLLTVHRDDTIDIRTQCVHVFASILL